MTENRDLHQIVKDVTSHSDERGHIPVSHSAPGTLLPGVLDALSDGEGVDDEVVSAIGNIEIDGNNIRTAVFDRQSGPAQDGLMIMMEIVGRFIIACHQGKIIIIVSVIMIMSFDITVM